MHYNIFIRLQDNPFQIVTKLNCQIFWCFIIKQLPRQFVNMIGKTVTACPDCVNAIMVYSNHQNTH